MRSCEASLSMTVSVRQTNAGSAQAEQATGFVQTPHGPASARSPGGRGYQGLCAHGDGFAPRLVTAREWVVWKTGNMWVRYTFQREFRSRRSFWSTPVRRTVWRFPPARLTIASHGSTITLTLNGRRCTWS